MSARRGKRQSVRPKQKQHVPTVTATAQAEAGGGPRATEHEDGEHVGGEDDEVRELVNPHGLSEVDRARIFAEEQRAIAEEAYRRSQEADALNKRKRRLEEAVWPRRKKWQLLAPVVRQASKRRLRATRSSLGKIILQLLIRKWLANQI